jgi:hypothetical protein
MDVVSDCDWNPRYNMFAVSGFGQEFPILVYVYERTKKELDLLLYEYGNLISQIDAAKMDLDDPQNADIKRNIMMAADSPRSLKKAKSQ